jgi:hypothetical protein
MPEGAVCRATVRVAAGDPAISETLPIDLDNKSGLLLRAEHPILPGQSGFDNRLTLRFDTPRGERGRDYLVRLRCTSNRGRLARLAGVTGGETLELKLASGMDNTLVYRWSGPPPTERAVAETVTVEIPELQLHGETSFSVGIDLMLESVRIAWKGPFYPGMALPVEAALVDRFHPEADLATLLTGLKIEPALELR